jgi:hypothetical protein
MQKATLASWCKGKAAIAGGIFTAVVAKASRGGAAGQHQLTDELAIQRLAVQFTDVASIRGIEQ